MSEGATSKQGQERDPAVRRSLMLTAAGVGFFFLTAVAISLIRGDSDASDPLGAKILFSALALLAVGAMVGGAVVAWRALRSSPLHSPRGVLSMRITLVVICVLPVMVAVLGLLSVLGVYEGDSLPFLAAWLLVATIASLLGASAPEPGRRGLMVVSLILGVAALVLALSEATGIS